MRIRNMRRYLSRLFHVAGERGFWLTTLGKTGRQFIWLVRPSLKLNADCPNLLIAGGIHGEEIAGPEAILKFLEQAEDSCFKKANLTFLPVLNPIGYNRGTRYARTGEKTNCGFCSLDSPSNKGDRLSVEGHIIIDNIDFLVDSGRDGFLSLHEDVTVDKFYVYDHSPKPGDFGRHMRDEEAKYFDRIENGTKLYEENDPDVIVGDGLVVGLHDGSFEDLMSHEGIPRVLATETPGLNIGLEKRADVGVALIKKFISLSRRYYRD